MFPSEFWQVNVLQLAHAEPAVWHAAVALGIMNKKFGALGMMQGKEGGSGNADETLALRRRAAQHYGRAMALAGSLNGPIKLATLCIVLVAVAGMLDRYGELQTHVLAGLKLIAAADGGTGASKLPSRHVAITRSLEGALMRADMQAMTFSDSSSPYPWSHSASVYAADRYLMMPVVTDESQMSYDDLASELFGLARANLLLDDGFLQGNLTHWPWLTRLDGLCRKLGRWEERIALMDAKRLAQGRDAGDSGGGVPHHQDTADVAAIIRRLSIRLYHSLLRLKVRAGPLGPETKYDPLLSHFDYTIRLASNLQAMLAQQQHVPGAASRPAGLSLEPGLIIPLWIVTHRCRHHHLRHAAIRLLEQMNRVEGTWRSDATAQVGRAVVGQEEGGSPGMMLTGNNTYNPPTLDTSWYDFNVPWSIWSKPDVEIPSTLSWADVAPVPEEKRVKDIMIKGNYNERRVGLRLLMTPTVDSNEPYGPARDVLVIF